MSPLLIESAVTGQGFPRVSGDEPSLELQGHDAA